MHVTFYKVDDGRLCSWTATARKGKPFQGTTMASGSNLPHDLAQFVVEATLGFQEGFWGLLANGATFESVAGRRRTKPGRQLIRAHHGALVETEHLVNGHVTAWRAARSTPAGSALDAMLARWRTLPAGAALHLEWATQHLPRVKQDAPRGRLASRRRAAAPVADVLAQACPRSASTTPSSSSWLRERAIQSSSFQASASTQAISLI